LKILKKIVSVRYNMILCAVATIKHMATHVQPIVPELHLTQTELVKNNYRILNNQNKGINM